jgi:hypothetical protein
MHYWWVKLGSKGVEMRRLASPIALFCIVLGSLIAIALVG